MLDNAKEVKISLWNALFAVMFTAGLAAGAGVATPLLEFANSQLPYFGDLGDLGTITWGLLLTLGALGGAAITNEFNYSEYAKWQRVALGVSTIGIVSVFLSSTVNTFVTGDVWIGLGVVLFGAVIYFIVSVADAKGALVN